jgi:uncharacterized DUF497 family protein
MRLDWDERKRQANLRKHGIDFADAAALFSTPMLIAKDRRRDYQEERQVALGETQGIIMFMVFTERGEKTRIISLRRANQRERRVYESFKNRLAEAAGDDRR